MEQIERERLEQERLEQELTNKILKNIKEINNANYNIKEYKKRFIEDKSKKKLPEEKLRPEDKTRLNNKIKSETDKIEKLRDENKNMSPNISPELLNNFVIRHLNLALWVTIKLLLLLLAIILLLKLLSSELFL